jgi:hypothetical protein
MGYALAIVYLMLFIVLFIFRNAAQRLILAPQVAEAQAKKQEEAAAAVGTEAKVSYSKPVFFCNSFAVVSLA